MGSKAAAVALIAALVASACGGDEGPTEPTGVFFPVPLTDLGTNLYGNFEGGLYPGGVNDPPADHAAEGMRRARLIRPLDVNGEPDANGRIVFLSVGVSFAAQEFCAVQAYLECEEWSFVGKALADPQVDPQITFVNGARAGSGPLDWAPASSAEYDRIRDQGLEPAGLSEEQVQVVWLKLASLSPGVALPFLGADAYVLTGQIAAAARALHQRYPNLQQVYVSSRSYGGYATVNLNPEPFAFQSGYSVKWLVESQIRQMRGEAPVPNVSVGNLDYGSAAPWLAWGPYLWAGDNELRGDGFSYVRADYEVDGTHPSQLGEQKIANLMLHFFVTEPTARCWFRAQENCS